MKSKTNLFFLLLLLSIFVFSNFLSYKFNDININKEIEKNQIKESGFWNLTGSPIFIDDNDPSKNWSYSASHYAWCSGSGNWADPYVIENVTINGQGSEFCIGIWNSDVYFTIRNCTVYKARVLGEGNGIKLFNVNNGKIVNNNCSDNHFYGIDLWESNNNTVSGNIANNNSMGMQYAYSHNNTIIGNNLTNNGYGILLMLSNNNKLSRNNAINNIEKGLAIDNSDNNTITENIACNNTYHYNYGITIHDSDNNRVLRNIANNNEYGIYINRDSKINNISGNTVNNNEHYGIFVFGSDNNTIYGNNASYNYGGIGAGSSFYNTVIGNTIKNNYKAIVFDNDCESNIAFLNYFIKNTIYAEDDGINDKWDNGSIGNYWYDYVGVDANHDGIGDTPYIISGTAGSQDNFPIWTDNIAPLFIVNSPLPNSVFGFDAPYYNISVIEPNLDTIWYTLDGGLTNYTITSSTGLFYQTAWESLNEGSVVIRFYANDTSGNMGFKDVQIIIEITEDLKRAPEISFGNFYLIFTFVTIISFIILLQQKKEQKRKKEVK